MAMIESKIILGLFLQAFEYKLSNERYELVFDIKTGYGPKEPIYYDMKR